MTRTWTDPATHEWTVADLEHPGAFGAAEAAARFHNNGSARAAIAAVRSEHTVLADAARVLRARGYAVTPPS